MAFDHRAIVLAGRERLRSKLSYTNIGFALAPDRFSISELSSIYTAALGYPVDPTNLRIPPARSIGSRHWPGDDLSNRPWPATSLDVCVSREDSFKREPIEDV